MSCCTQVKHCNVMLKILSFNFPLITREYAWRIITEQRVQQKRQKHHHTVLIIYSMQIDKQRMALELRGALMWKDLQFLYKF